MNKLIENERETTLKMSEAAEACGRVILYVAQRDD